MENTSITVVESLEQAHRALMKDLVDLEEASRSSLGMTAAQIGSRLARTRTHITDHFRFEEHNGYMDATLHREPNLARSIEHLRVEHRQIAQALDDLIEQTQMQQYTEDALRAQIRSWIEKVRQHEARENTLVQDAFNVDVGSED
jgi:hypothetical protein